MREEFRSLIDLTVRLKVRCTSLDRPDEDELAEYRGTGMLRVGTGCIWLCSGPEYNKPCVCFKCAGKVAEKHWTFHVRTAQHVVYNSEEARKTKVDLFYDDSSCQRDGKMWSVMVVDKLSSPSEIDWCDMLCATCDEDLGGRIESAWSCWLHEGVQNPQDLSGLNLVPFCDEGPDPVVIVSHPHGQPKKITVGEVKYRAKRGPRIMEYNTPTCPGSSGATVFAYDRNRGKFSYISAISAVHSGSYDKPCTEHKHRFNLLKRIFNKLRGHEATVVQLNYGYCGVLVLNCPRKRI
ncbi:hypothetical protein ElyMa_003445500 [Elysia marginata]|uniref:Peptidase S1 domain-containing protein n=1 Tax=Elysia marginata TaxID=1093978 RepID=A0AAV4JXF4_9GAST|nr:hypothetical protein ElyMa_003445500 [Elysia marginata]